MNKSAAFRASYSDLKLIKTRQVVQIVLELPLADFDAAYDILGGLPDSSKERWFAVAPLNSNAVEPTGKRDWRDLPPSQQAGIRCDEPSFVAFLRERDADDWRESGHDAAECVRLICGVASRSELGTNHKARMIWHSLDEQYAAWKALEHA